MFIPTWERVSESIGEAFYTYMLEDGVSAQEALDNAAPLLQEDLDEAWETWEQLTAN